MPFRDYAFLRDHTVVTEVITALDEQRAWWKKIMTSMHGLRDTEFFVNIGHPLFMSSDNLGIRFNGEPGSDAGALTRELYGLVFKRWIYSSAEDKKDQEEKDGDEAVEDKKEKEEKDGDEAKGEDGDHNQDDAAEKIETKDPSPSPTTNIKMTYREFYHLLNNFNIKEENPNWKTACHKINASDLRRLSTHGVDNTMGINFFDVVLVHLRTLKTDELEIRVQAQIKEHETKFINAAQR